MTLWSLGCNAFASMHAQHAIKRRCFLLGVLLFGGPALSRGAEPAWFEKKATQIDTYLACLSNIQKMELAKGSAVPAFQNDAKLPMIVFLDVMTGNKTLKFKLDVSGVDKLYMGAAGGSRMRQMMVDRGDGVEMPLYLKGKPEVKVDLSDIKNVWTNAARNEVEIKNDGEITLELGGHYKWISGAFNITDGVGWIDNASRLGKYKTPLALRKEACRKAGFDEKILGSILPSGYAPVDLNKAVQIIADAVDKRVDPAIVRAVTQAAEAVKTGADYERFIKVSEVARQYDRFMGISKKVDAVKTVPGVKIKFDATVRKAFFQLDVDAFDYLNDMIAVEKNWGDLIKKTEMIAGYAESATHALDKAGRSSPATDAVKKELARLDKELAGVSGDLDKYLAKYAEMQAVFLKALTRQPLFDFDEILINRNPPTKYSHNGDQHLGRHSRIGKGLSILSGWKTGHPVVRTLLEGKMPPGAYRNPDLSYDGKRVVFAFCDHTEPNPNYRRYFIYEAAIDGSWVRQLTGTKRDTFETWYDRATVLIEDNDPCYLPSGEIVFVSTRCQSFGRCHGGRYNPAWNLHKCDKDGNHIVQLSYGNENEVEPSVLDDGRIIFTRWEYTNRHEMFFHKLWWCRPDGTSVTHFFGNDMIVPHQFLEATAIPGKNKIVATAQGHHSYNTGTTVVIDPQLSENGEAAIAHITPETPYSESQGWPSPHYSHPYPLSEEWFLVSRANHPVPPQGRLPPEADRAIYLVNAAGLREKIYEDPEVASVSPIPIRVRTTPPALPSTLPEKAEPFGLVFLQNAYLTRNDPKGIIKPGMIKWLRINELGVQPRASRLSCTMTVPNDLPKKVLGTVPVDADGSAVFKVPANTSLQMQILDENGMALMTEKSFFYLMPGEVRSCIGCHEGEGTTPDVTIAGKLGKMQQLPIKPAAGPQYKGGMSFARTVQPVLDRYCITCHGLDKTEKEVNLVYDTWRYPQSLRAIVSRGQHRIGDKGFSGSTYAEYPGVSVNISRPRKFYAYENQVAQMLLKGEKNHPKLAETDRESYMRIIEWLDLNGQCFGDLFPNRIEDRKFDEKGLAALRENIKEVYGEKIAKQPASALVNVAQPEESRVLMMGLPAKKGGWQQVKAFSDTSDPKYRKMAALIDACIIRNPAENTNGWEPSLIQGGGEGWVMEARDKYRADLKTAENKK